MFFRMTENTQKKFNFFIKKYWTVVLALSILIALFVLKTERGTLYRTDEIKAENVHNEHLKDRTETKSGQSFDIAKNEKKASPQQVRDPGTPVATDRTDVALKARLFELESDNENLKRELIEISKKHEELLRNTGKAELAIAEICSPTVPDKRLDEIKVLEAISEKAALLALSGQALSDNFMSAMERYEKDPVKKAESQLLTDSFRKDLSGLLKYTKAPTDTPVKRCRILAVNDELKVAVIDAGYMNGIRNGISLYGPGKVKMRIILCRPYLAAVLVTEGSFSDIAPGMEVSLTKPEK